MSNARTDQSTSFVNQLIFGNFAGALVFLFGAFQIWTKLQSRRRIFLVAIFFLLASRPGCVFLI